MRDHSGTWQKIFRIIFVWLVFERLLPFQYSELEYLRTTIGVSHEESSMAPPWKAMMTSQAVWAIIVAHFAENWGFYTLLTGLPMFMRGNFHYIMHIFNLITN